MNKHLGGINPTEFLKDMEVRNYSPLSVLKYARCIRIFFEFLKGKGISDFRKIGRDELREYLEYLTQNPKYSVGYIGANIRAVKLFFKYLKRTNSILFDFSVYLKEPKMPKALPKDPLTESEVKGMLEAPDLRTERGIRDRAILETFYSTGIRVQEMSNLTLMDIDLEKGLLFVREGKGKKDRVVPLGKHACFFIRAYLDGPRNHFLKNAKGAVKALWINKWGRPLLKADILWMVRKCRKKAGIEKQVTPHSFRRTLAVELIRNECDFLSVKSILGHSKSSTTLRYCALSGVDLKDAVKRCHPRYEFEGPEDVIPQIKSMGKGI
ncbi:MAG TPA: tyrosine-type recombinase/integrase [Puia sp.]|nr:tyrosine-type recombinase/integrase [Puia sp.]